MTITAEPIKISDSEWEIMRVIWTKQETTAQEISEILGETMDWKPATIKTLLGRLVKKDAVYTKQAGKKYIYYPKISESKTVKSATENLFSHICAKQIGNTIAELVDEAELTEADVAKIMATLNKKETVAEVVCNCIPGQCECKHHSA
ncbi:CopY/TcrY family copper transport repressor [Enterococcus alishanensis]|uniref:CopY/TcrY family copper transport repressor n=1 Tax=Enterococcus alishanensis TaxID=1303817 RepID=A0ABS6T8S8_9ENTE|nr:CopY/TcrY family copper transport repressor [Enterococcus alishanensis]MBV7389309.1 CopY/TcrY family copper transport repressor [Enterococcus alishanensis]